MVRLTKTLYVRVEKGGNGEEWLTASPGIHTLMDDDGPSTVGVYRLIETRRVEKLIKVTPGRRVK